MNLFIDYGINGIDLRAGGQQRTLCPECSHSRQNHPNEKCLSVNVDDKTWLCHHCAWSGGIKEKDARKTWQDAPKPKKINFHNDTKSDAMVEYFKSRGITKDVLEVEKIVTVSAYGKDWIAFPYSIESEIVNVKYRGLSQK